ncbi:putative quinol monooxygenase [Shewanella surugensis]|uniref:Antibiotic biosynthesis monooxygenase n=1 Tax=Shewanella surugensis TaxID=212020 RepID=A0ABT0LDE2_9GAMM|nr:putative quinol monooxygenase [Shewanella surugensis]MCL1125690.1 antibiotic biosynthesis monooxygenase [Shewanella surugensis]
MIVIRIRLKVDEANQEELLSYFNAEVQRNKTLEGCITYTLYQDVSECNDFILYEEWESIDTFNRYKNSVAFSKMMTRLKPLLAGVPDSVYYDADIVGP